MKLTSATITNKDVRFTRQLAILALIGSVFYLLFDTYLEAFNYLPVYGFLIVGSTICLFLLSKGHILLSKGILLTSAYITVTCFASVENLESGVYYYYILLSISALTLYGYKQRKFAIIFIIIAVSLFCFVLFTDINFIPEVELTEKYIRASLTLNFFIILIASILIIYYLLENNHRAETTLNNHRENLIRATSELEKSQRRFELAIQGSSAAIWDWDVVNDMIYVTPKLGDILQRPVDQLQGATRDKFLKIIHPDDVSLFEIKLENHFNYREKFEIECRVRTGDGKYVWVLDSGQAEWDSDYKPIRMVGTIVDINEKKRAIERVKEQNFMLAKTNEELDRFVYSTSHDLRAPLSSLLGLINLAGSSTKKEDRDELIHMMKNQIVKLDSYIQDITDYSRNARVDITKEHFSLNEVIAEAVMNLKFMEGAESVELVNNVDNHLYVYSDKSRFKVIINNLLSNAIKYRDPEKKSYLRINNRKEAGMDIIYFEDNGIGIEKEHHDKVFKMFYRASDRSRGSGLGLYIANEIAAKIDLQLSLESEVRKGSVFVLKIPHENSTLG